MFLIGCLNLFTPYFLKLGSTLFSFNIPPNCRLTGGQWKMCAVSLAAWPVGPPIPFQLGFPLGYINIWRSPIVSSIVLIYRSIPYHYSLVPGCQKNHSGSNFFQTRVHFIPYTVPYIVPYPFHTRSMPEPCHMKLIPISELFRQPVRIMSL